jgi:hypothetical protein
MELLDWNIRRKFRYLPKLRYAFRLRMIRGRIKNAIHKSYRLKE